MSTRWYPLYQKGNPQLRIFLPNFWLKLVKPNNDQPPNVVQFQCSMEMTKHDVKNYLEKIYNVPTIGVRTRIARGKYKRDKNKKGILKEDDFKVAYAILPKEETFVYPDLFVKDEKQLSNETKTINELKQSHRDFLKQNNKPGLPGWFSF